MHASCAELNEEQDGDDVDGFEEEGFDREEVAGQDLTLMPSEEAGREPKRLAQDREERQAGDDDDERGRQGLDQRDGGRPDSPLLTVAT